MLAFPPGNQLINDKQDFLDKKVIQKNKNEI